MAESRAKFTGFLGLLLPGVKRFFRFAVCLSLCCLLVFLQSYRKPVKAEAALTTVATVAGVVAVAAAASALGIGIGASMSGESYQQACQNIWDGVSDGIKNQLILTDLAVHDGLAQLTLTQDFLRSVYDGFKAYFAQAPSDSYISGSFTIAQLSSVCHIPLDEVTAMSSKIDFSSFSNLAYISSWTFPSLPATENDTSTLTLPYVDAVLTHHSQSLNYWNITSYSADWASGPYYYYPGNDDPSGGLHPWQFLASPGSLWQFYYATYTSYSGAVFPCIFFTNTESGFTQMCKPASTDAVLPDYEGQDYFDPSLDSLFADGYSCLNNKLDDILDRLRQRVGDSAGNIPVSVPADGDIADQRTRTQSQTVGKDIATDEDRTRDATYNDTHDKDTTQPKSGSVPDLTIPQAVTKKFPFSIPWDLYNSISNLSATGQAPVFDLPVKLSALGIDTAIHLDFSAFDTAAMIVRWGLSLIFLIGLIILTGHVIKH